MNRDMDKLCSQFDNSFLELPRAVVVDIEDHLDETNSVKIMYNRWKIPVFKLPMTFAVKCPDKFVDLKNRANQLFQKRAYDDALKAYNAAVLHAASSHDKAVLYYNRSAFFQHRKKYKLAILDCISAIQTGFENLKFDVVYLRIETCLDSLGMEKQLSKMKLEKTNFDLNSLATVLSKRKILQKPLPEEAKKFLRTNFPRNVLNPALSKKVKISRSPDVGRFIQATEDINIGEFVLQEKPILHGVEPVSYGSEICHHCLRMIAAAEPCSRCSRVAFCSKACSKDASYHEKYECFLVDDMTKVLNENMLHRAMLTLRFLTNSNVNDIIEATKNVFERNNDVDTAWNQYEKMFTCKWYPELLQRGDIEMSHLSVVYIMAAMKKLGFFDSDLRHSVKLPESPTPKLSNAEFYVAIRLLRLFRILQYNTAGFDMKTSFPKSGPMVGIAVYTDFKRMSHSCLSNTISFQVGLDCFALAIRPIRAGESVSTNYGVESFTMPTETRRRHLKEMFGFYCMCTLCVNPLNWQAEYSAPKYNRYMCKICWNVVSYGTRCSNCNNLLPSRGDVALEYQVEEFRVNQLQRQLELKKITNFNDLGFLEEIICEYHAVFGTPNYDAIVPESIYTCMLIMIGFRQEESLDF